MAAGNQPTVTGVNQSLTTYAQQLRDLMQTISDFNMQIADLGATGLQALPSTGFTASDAADVISKSAILNTIAAVYFGTATQATLYNFHQALSPLWAGQ